MKKRIKKIVSIVICVASLGTLMYSAIPSVKTAASSNILGTNTALGSPILNAKNFSTKDWNQWESVCWGVYLSNFTQPLIDSYTSAFTAGKGGSEGSGFKALWGGSGSDEANIDIIKALTEYATDKADSSGSEIYVAWTAVTNMTKEDGTGFVLKSKTAYKDQKATFSDLWLAPSYEKSDVENAYYKLILESAGSEFTRDKTSGTITTKSESPFKNTFAASSYGDNLLGIEWFTERSQVGGSNEYDAIATVKIANLPTFYVKSGGENVIVLDYNDWWDVQIPAMITNALRSGDYEKQFEKTFETLYSQGASATLTLDAFANIVVSNPNQSTSGNNLVVIPSCMNQHITDGEENGNKPSINLVTSWIMNGYTSTYTEEQLYLGLRQNLETKSGFEADMSWLGNDQVVNGYPAFGESNVGNVGLLYYDLDSVMMQNNYIKGLNLKYGENLSQLFSLDIKNKSIQLDYPLKFELAGNGVGRYGILSKENNSVTKVLRNTSLTSNMLVNTLFMGGGDNDSDGIIDASQKDVLSNLVDTSGKEISLFSDTGVAVAVKALTSKPSEEPTNQGGIRTMYSYMYKLYRGSIASTISASSFSGRLKTLSWAKMEDWIADDFWGSFTGRYKKYKDISDRTGWFNTLVDYGSNESVQTNTNRVVVAYPVSDTMKAVSSILGIKDGTEFSVYSTLIYMTYLNFYGVSTKDTLMSDGGTSKFNAKLFNADNRIIDIAKTITEYGADFSKVQDIDKQVVNMGYLLLEPEKGRDYRKTLIENGVYDWIYEQYNRMVYGGSADYTGSASRSNSGFLAVENYYDNILTGWFIENYADIAIWMIALSIIATIVIGLLRSRKVSWYVVSIFVIINTLLLVPATGEIVPYITSSMVQNMFRDKMTFWSISQGVTNASIEKDASNLTNAFDGMTEEEASMAMSLVGKLSTVFTDNSLTVKQDISQKLTQNLNSTYASIESYQSARWLIPMVMQQFSGDNSSAEYIYKPIANIYDDMSNMYWYFNPVDATFVDKQSATATSGQNESATHTLFGETGNISASVSSYTMYNKLKDYYKDVNITKNTENSLEDSTGVHYRCYSYSLNKPEQQVHLISTYLPTVNLSWSRADVFGANYSNYEDSDSWQKYIDLAVKNSTAATVGNWATDKKGVGFEYTADSYDRDNRASVTNDMPYLLNTESNMYYMYNVIKDSFSTDSTVAKLLGNIQGTIKLNGKKEEVRNNFMYATICKGSEVEIGDTTEVKYTGEIRDILDLQEMFTNVVPYLYQMQLVTGGFDGKSGILRDDNGKELYITKELNFYEGTLQSWMYRSNWATKLMENNNFSKETTVLDSSGNEYTVENPLLADSYPKSRPMVFSNAQKVALGLEDRDLSLVELKCIAVNKAVAKQWTLLLNYAGTSGITKEVLMRQMALDASMIFNEEFSSSGILDTSYDLYPQSVDLRYLSFDSVAKILMMNVSRDTNYVYGDTMQTVIEDTDLTTSILLLVSTFLCTNAVPFFRVILMALIFYLGFIAIGKALFSKAKDKVKIAGGQLVSNMLFTIITLIYFSCFKAMMAVTTVDEIISTDSVGVSAGNPVWVVILMILASVIYMLALIKLISFCFTNFRDMGFAAYSFFASTIIDRVQNTTEKIIGGIEGEDGESTNGGEKDGESIDSDGGTTGKRKRRKKNEEESEEDGVGVNEDELDSVAEQSESEESSRSKERDKQSIDNEISAGQKLRDNS
jgi:hypothetical protein